MSTRRRTRAEVQQLVAEFVGSGMLPAADDSDCAWGTAGLCWNGLAQVNW